MSIYQNGNVDTWTVYILTFYLSTVHFFTRITWQSIPKYASLIMTKMKIVMSDKVPLLQCFNAEKNRVAPYQSCNKYTITNANDTVYATPIKKYTKQNTKNTNIILGCFVRGEIFVTYVLFGVFLTGLLWRTKMNEACLLIT